MIRDYENTGPTMINSGMTNIHFQFINKLSLLGLKIGFKNDKHSGKEKEYQDFFAFQQNDLDNNPIKFIPATATKNFTASL